MAQPSAQQLLPLGKAILRSLQSPVAQRVLDALEGDHDSMLNISVSPHGYTSADVFGRDYMAVSLLSKWDGWKLSVDPETKAMSVFMEGEARNREINRNGYDPRWSSVYTEGRALGTRYEAICQIAKRIISDVLPPFSWDLIYPLVGFSGGASTRLPRRFGDPSFKYQGKPETTQKCKILAICDIWSSPLWREAMQSEHGNDPDDWVVVVGGSRLDLVEKNAKTKRVINIEPDMNMRWQKGIGRYFRRALRKVGVNLNSQALNQYLAYIGSIDGTLATIDLENASGSISQRVVWDHFPTDWAEAMDLVRCSGCYLPDGTWHQFEMWSSMGNGFTFELESLLFWALAKATRIAYGELDKRLSVYGDDIVVPTSLAEPLIGVLGYCGFRTNVQKTFYYGAFRESCGKHYFLGEDVTPVYWKRLDATTLDGCLIANSYVEWATRFPSVASNDLYNYLVAKAARLHGPKPGLVPDGYGLKSGIIATWDNARPWTTSNLCSRPLAYVFTTLSFTAMESEQPEYGRYLSCLETPPDTLEPSPYERKLARKGKMRAKRTYDPAWIDPVRTGSLYVTRKTQRLLSS
jgi:hypothetical protein